MTLNLLNGSLFKSIVLNFVVVVVYMEKWKKARLKAKKMWITCGKRMLIKD